MIILLKRVSVFGIFGGQNVLPCFSLGFGLRILEGVIMVLQLIIYKKKKKKKGSATNGVLTCFFLDQKRKASCAGKPSFLGGNIHFYN